MRLAKAEAIYRPNLLINGNFKSNQRGQSSYNNTGSSWTRKYTVDMWCLLGDNGAVSLTINEDDSVTIVNSSTSECYFAQMFDNLPEDDYTMSANVVSFTGTVKMYPEGSMETAIIVNNGINTITRNGTPNGVSFRLDGNSSVTLKWAKLEQGLFATVYYEEDEAIAQMRSSKYVRTYRGSIGIGSCTLASRVIVALPIDMIELPMLTPTNVSVNAAGVTSFTNDLTLGDSSTKDIVFLVCNFSGDPFTTGQSGTVNVQSGRIILSCEP